MSKEIPSKTIVSRREFFSFWWVQSIVKTGLFVGCGLFLIYGIGQAQRLGWIQIVEKEVTKDEKEQIEYSCAMHPNISSTEPGTCPECPMPLIPKNSLKKVQTFVEIAPATRRVANIQTVSVEEVAVEKTIRAIGEIAFDESRMKTISAYVPGRLEKLYADYEGVVVKQGEPMVVLYSPNLYSAQVEYLNHLEHVKRDAKIGDDRFSETNRKLLEDSREKLIEYGMAVDQIWELEKTGKAQTRLTIRAPIGGTVIQKVATEGEYVKVGQPIYKVADLSLVWIVLKLFPDDAAQIRFGQKVDAKIQSLPGIPFQGRVAFIDPVVDSKTQTVGVRVEVLNERKQLRPGDYATAYIQVPLSADQTIYDAELAGKWISPRHPQIVRNTPGKCPLCGIDLVPTSTLGFSDTPTGKGKSLLIPRSAILSAGENHVVYVEIEDGKFEIRKIVLGQKIKRKISSPFRSTEYRSYVVVLKGLNARELVATSGNFLIDSQMQIFGNMSIIDPEKAPTEYRGPLDVPKRKIRLYVGTTGQQLEKLYNLYFEVHGILANDMTPSKELARQIQDITRQLHEDNSIPVSEKKLLEVVHENSEYLKRGLNDARKHFKPISRAVLKLASLARGDDSETTYIQFYCSMVEDGKGDWLQNTSSVLNPYKGSKMLRCADRIREFTPQKR